MQSTRDRILEAAREAFNQQGLGASTRDIAQAAGIRQGNLTYHFARREALVEALYEGFIAGIDAVFAGVLQPPLTLAKLYQAQVAQGELQQRYRFLFLDFAAIRQAHPKVDQHFQALMQQREAGFGLLIQALQANGTLQAELEADTQALLFEQFVIVGNFWPHAAAVFRPEEPEAYRHYARVTLGLLRPYLTEAGRREWEEVERKTEV